MHALQEHPHGPASGGRSAIGKTLPPARTASTLGVVTRVKLRLYDVSGTYTGVLVYADDPQHDTFK